MEFDVDVAVAQEQRWQLCVDFAVADKIAPLLQDAAEDVRFEALQLVLAALDGARPDDCVGDGGCGLASLGAASSGRDGSCVSG